MVNQLKDRYPEFQPTTNRKHTPTWIYLLIGIFAASSVTIFTYLVWSEKQYLNLSKEALRSLTEPIKIITPTKPIRNMPVLKIQPKINNQDQSEKIYSWTDENGIKQFSNIQPTGNVNDLKVLRTH